MIKRLITALTVLVLCSMLFACSGEETEALKQEQPAVTEGADTPEATVSPDSSAEGDMPLVFSEKSGIYPEEFLLYMSASDVQAEIYYTVDGSDPAVSETAVKYTEALRITDRKNDANVVSAVDPLLISGNFNAVTLKKDAFKCKIDAPEDSAVDKCTVVRAAVRRPDGTFGEEVSGTYFIGAMAEHINGIAQSCEASGTTLSVISICADYDSFFDSKTGIYVKGDVFNNALDVFLKAGAKLKEGEDARGMDANYKQKGREWERTVRVSFMECDSDSANEVLAQTCGIRIQGNYSRSDLQKGLRLYAREEYGKKNFKYPFFGEDYVNKNGEVMDKFKTLVLRNGGNCAFTSKFNDTYWQSMLAEADCGTQKSRPCIVYLNGEYWGLYILQEDYTDNHMENLYGVDKNDVVIYKGDAEALKLGYKLDEGSIPEGEHESYYFNELFGFFDSHDDLKSGEAYDAFCEIVDPQSVLDYFAVQIWINNKWDWPGKNWSMWRTITDDGGDDSYGDGRWRFLFYDMEFGGVSGSSDARANTIKEDNYKPDGLLDFDTSNPAVLCFAYLMTNDGFRAEFSERLTGLSEGFFEQKSALARLDEFEAVYGPLYEQFFRRYEGTGSADNAINGGYATGKCIRDFLAKRKDHIQPMLDFAEEVAGRRN